MSFEHLKINFVSCGKIYHTNETRSLLPFGLAGVNVKNKWIGPYLLHFIENKIKHLFKAKLNFLFEFTFRKPIYLVYFLSFLNSTPYCSNKVVLFKILAFNIHCFKLFETELLGIWEKLSQMTNKLGLRCGYT